MFDRWLGKDFPVLGVALSMERAERLDLECDVP